MNFTKILLSNESPSFSVSLHLLLNHISIEIREKIPAYSLSLAMWFHVKKAKKFLFTFLASKSKFYGNETSTAQSVRKKPIWPLTKSVFPTLTKNWFVILLSFLKIVLYQVPHFRKMLFLFEKMAVF